jgi:hypothetical protein
MIVGVDSGETETLVRPFLRQNGVPYEVGLDPEDALKDLFGVESFPTSILIGRDGKIALYETGALLNADVALGPAFSAARHEKAISTVDWRAALAKAPPLPGHQNGDTVRLSGRPRLIATDMSCPCGCSETVLHCTCQTRPASKNVSPRCRSRARPMVRS